ncbi:hypothetical protein BGX38DRAFT_1144148 [Terfezia claveryi]|nr:hypothetical protein BGX38DRAFT_1144148 [Terfezia claveryi]
MGAQQMRRKGAPPPATSSPPPATSPSTPTLATSPNNNPVGMQASPSPRPLRKEKHNTLTPATYPNNNPLGNQASPSPHPPKKEKQTTVRDKETFPGFFSRGPINTRDITRVNSATTTQILVTGCPSRPGRGKEWEQAFLNSFNVRREHLAPEISLKAISVSAAQSYLSERIITLQHRPELYKGKILTAVSKVRDKIFNTEPSHSSNVMVSILTDTTELVAPGLQERMSI